MSLQFKCPDCLNDIVVRYLKPGEEAICRSCGSRVVVPSCAEETDLTPDYRAGVPDDSGEGEPPTCRDLANVLWRRRIQALVVTVATTAGILMSVLPRGLGGRNALVLTALGCGCTGLATYVLVGQNLKRRHREFKDVGTVMGLQYECASMEPGASAFGGLPLFGRGSGREMIHVMRGHYEWLFDYEYKLGYRRPKKSHTVAVFQLYKGRLPDFRLHAESLSDRLDAAFGFQDIDFADDDEFSALFRLRCENEDLARQMFSASLRGQLRGYPGLTFEGKGEWLAIYTRVRCEIGDLARFVSDTAALARAFESASTLVR